MEKTVLISNVQYDATKKHIETVGAVVFSGSGAPQVEKLSREQVASYIGQGFTALTLIKGKDGTLGCSEVLAYDHAGTKVLRTKGNETGDDNLSSLPPLNW